MSTKQCTRPVIAIVGTILALAVGFGLGSPPATTVANECDAPTYLSGVETQARSVTDAGNRLSLIAEDPRVLQPSWRRGIRDELVSWRGFLDDAEGLCAPQELADVHERYIAGMERIVAAGDYLIQALDLIEVSLDTLDLNGMQRAIPLVEQAMDEANQAAAIFNEVQALLTDYRLSLRGE
jgi:hypothetical protein